MKIKSSEVLSEALLRIKDGRQSFACAAIQDVETDLRFLHKQEIQSKALKIFMQFKPKEVRDDVKQYSQWWPKGDAARLEALEKAVNVALEGND